MTSAWSLLLTCLLCCAQIVYWDGQFNDSRFNVALAVTASLAGATVLNYAAVEGFLKVCCMLDARRHN